MKIKDCSVINELGFLKTNVTVYFEPDDSGAIVLKIQGYTLKKNEFLVESIAPFKTFINPEGFVRPRWNGEMWVEGATPKEVTEWESEHPAPPPLPPTPMELLQEENRLLRAQITAESDRSDFIEDCIAEMAAQVYV